jgi:hypothetical protein
MTGMIHLRGTLPRLDDSPAVRRRKGFLNSVREPVCKPKETQSFRNLWGPVAARAAGSR